MLHVRRTLFDTLVEVTSDFFRHTSDTTIAASSQPKLENQRRLQQRAITETPASKIMMSDVIYSFQPWLSYSAVGKPRPFWPVAFRGTRSMIFGNRKSQVTSRQLLIFSKIQNRIVMYQLARLFRRHAPALAALNQTQEPIASIVSSKSKTMRTFHQRLSST